MMISLAVRRLHDAGYSGLWMFLAVVPFGIFGLFWIWAKQPSRTRRGQFTWKSRHAWGVGLTFGLAIILVLRGLYQPFWIPSGSMKPALMPGDYILAAPSSRYKPERGDVVVFKHPVAGGRFREAPHRGCRGDRVQMRSGTAFINGVALEQVPMDDLQEPKLPAGPAQSLPRCANDPLGSAAPAASAKRKRSCPLVKAIRSLILSAMPSRITPQRSRFPRGSISFSGIIVTIRSIAVIPLRSVAWALCPKTI